jgi:hypothetical protein
MCPMDPARGWESFARERLGSLDLTITESEEIVAELAAHLEDLYAQYREQGVPETCAVASALKEVSDWRELGRKIRRARRKENEMNQRTKAVWIPGLISLTVASGVLALLQVWGVRPYIVWTRSGLALLFYIPWLIAQPAFGAIGAYISRRNGGTSSERLTAGLLPAAAMLAAFCFFFCLAIVLNIITNGHEITLIGLSLYIASWAVIPGCALALGALPFLSDRRRVAPETVGVA